MSGSNKANSLVGILPASGSASRLKGIPKFLLPISDNKTIIEWHVDLLAEVCSVVRISTQKKWINLLSSINFNANVEIYEIEPSTMSDAINKMILDPNEKHIIGHPDIFILNSNSNFYKNLVNQDVDMSVSAFLVNELTQGKVGQIKINNNNFVVDLVDKDPQCLYEYMWGAMMITNTKVNPEYRNVGIQINDWINQGIKIKAIKESGMYIDCGTFTGLKNLYSNL